MVSFQRIYAPNRLTSAPCAVDIREDRRTHPTADLAALEVERDGIQEPYTVAADPASGRLVRIVTLVELPTGRSIPVTCPPGSCSCPPGERPYDERRERSERHATVEVCYGKIELFSETGDALVKIEHVSMVGVKIVDSTAGGS